MKLYIYLYNLQHGSKHTAFFGRGRSSLGQKQLITLVLKFCCQMCYNIPRFIDLAVTRWFKYG